MVRLGLHHPESGYTHWGPEVVPIPHGTMAGWDLREATGGAIQAVATYMDKPIVAIMTEHNSFIIVVKETADG
jgi:hypothetical protein